MSAQEGCARPSTKKSKGRMEEKFGKLQDNIMLEAMDQALSETNLQICGGMAGRGYGCGVKVVDKDIAKAEALAMFLAR